MIPPRVEESLQRSGQSPYVPACDLLQPIELASAPGIAVWGRFGLAELLAELLAEPARALDRPLATIAPAWSLVQVPRSHQGQGWRWHASLGCTRRR